MTKKVSDLTVEELKMIIDTSVKASIEDALEDLSALNSKEYLRSVERARQEYRDGRFHKIDEVFQ